MYASWEGFATYLISYEYISKLLLVTMHTEALHKLIVDKYVLLNKYSFGLQENQTPNFSTRACNALPPFFTWNYVKPFLTASLFDRLTMATNVHKPSSSCYPTKPTSQTFTPHRVQQQHNKNQMITTITTQDRPKTTHTQINRNKNTYNQIPKTTNNTNN